MSIGAEWAFSAVCVWGFASAAAPAGSPAGALVSLPPEQAVAISSASGAIGWFS
jgi:hypothetical protein